MIKRFTQGGQLMAHGVRMFRQVISILLLTYVFSFILSLSIYLYFNTEKEHWTGAQEYYWSKLLVFFGKNDAIVDVYPNKSARASTIAYSTYWPYQIKLLGNHISKGTKMSLKASALMMTAIGILFTMSGRRREGHIHKRGPGITDPRSLCKLIKRDNRGYAAYEIAGIPYHYKGEMQNTLVTGSTGSGKTQVISDIVEQIRARGDRAIIYDAKCDYVSWFYNEQSDYILNPFDERGRKWNLLAQITDAREIKGIVSGFIPDKEYGDKIWEEAARVVCTSVLQELFSSGDDLTNEEILDVLLKKDAKQLSAFLQNSYAKNLINPESPKTAYSVLFVISSYLNALKFTKGHKGDSFVIKNWIKDARDSILFITSNQKYKADLMPLETAFFEIAIRDLISERRDVKTWFIIDELPTLQKIPSLSRALSISRASGGCFVLGIQNIAQLREIYSKNGAQNMISECNTKAIFRTNDPDTAKWASDLIGDYEFEEYKEGLSYGAHKMRDGVSIQSQEKRKNIIMPSEFLSMPNLELVVKLSNFPTTKTRVRYQEREIVEQAENLNEKTPISIVETDDKKEGKKAGGLITEIAEDIPPHISSSPDKQEDKNTDNSTFSDYYLK